MLKCFLVAIDKTNLQVHSVVTSYHLDKEVRRYFNKKTFFAQREN